MDLILGMDPGVFVAWIGTLLAALLCIGYGLYHQLLAKPDGRQRSAPPAEHEEDPR